MTVPITYVLQAGAFLAGTLLFFTAPFRKKDILGCFYNMCIWLFSKPYAFIGVRVHRDWVHRSTRSSEYAFIGICSSGLGSSGMGSSEYAPVGTGFVGTRFIGTGFIGVRVHRDWVHRSTCTSDLFTSNKTEKTITRGCGAHEQKQVSF